uniref:Uncharacterized protein n=1 Tax=Cyclophora tenuis TaxID=216820 RepID=A0A7S1D6G0_CYCTE
MLLWGCLPKRKNRRVKPCSAPYPTQEKEQEKNKKTRQEKKSRRRFYKRLLSREIEAYWATCMGFNSLVDNKHECYGFIHGGLVFEFGISSDGNSFHIQTEVCFDTENLAVSQQQQQQLRQLLRQLPEEMEIKCLPNKWLVIQRCIPIRTLQSETAFVAVMNKFLFFCADLRTCCCC